MEKRSNLYDKLNRLGESVVRNLASLIVMNLVFFYLVWRIYDGYYEYLFSLNDSYLLGAPFSRDQLSCFSCDTDVFWIKSVDKYLLQILLLTIAISIGSVYSIILVLKRLEIEQNRYLRFVFSLSFPIPFIVFFFIENQFFGRLENDKPIIYSGIKDNIDSIFHDLNKVLLVFLVLFNTLMLLKGYFLQKNSDQTNSISVLFHVQKKQINSLLFFTFVITFLMNLPYWPTRFMRIVAFNGFDPTVVGFDGATSSDNVVILSGLFIVSLHIIGLKFALEVLEIISATEDGFAENERVTYSSSQPKAIFPVALGIISLIIIGIVYYIAILDSYGSYKQFGGNSLENQLRQKWNNDWNPFYINITVNNIKPNSDYRWGTDAVGRDIYARMYYGLGLTFLLIFVLSISRLVIGLILGLVIRKMANDRLKFQIADILSDIPRFPIMLVYGAYLMLIFSNYTNDMSSPFIASTIVISGLFLSGDLIREVVRFEGKITEVPNAFILLGRMLYASLIVVLVEVSIIAFIGFGSGTGSYLIWGMDAGNALGNLPTEMRFAWENTSRPIVYFLMILAIGYNLLRYGQFRTVDVLPQEIEIIADRSDLTYPIVSDDEV